MITSILLDGDEFKHFKILDNDKNETKELKNLSRINVFIGPNNSGKSRFLREVFKVKNLKYKRDTLVFDNRFLPSEIRLHLDNPLIDVFNQNVISTENEVLKEYISEDIQNYNKDFKRTYLENLKDKPIDLRTILIDIFNGKINLKNNYLYIPILRGLRPIQHNLINNSENKIVDFDVYKFRTIKDYYLEMSANDKRDLKEQNKQIYTGLDIYKSIDKIKKSSKPKRLQIENFEKLLSTYFFENKKVELTAIEESDVLSIHVEDFDERFIYEVGDGIQALITLLYPLYINADQENTLVFIEEPELNLHPGMQRIFLEVLKSDAFKNFQFFFTTHSNHFLDMSFEQESDISVYRFKKNSETEYEVKNLSNPDHNLLQDLGVRNSSVFLSNCTIWVEGVTDRLYLKKFLEVYEKHKEAEGNSFKKYREDLHYAFVEYAGSNITHWDFSEDSDPEKIKALSLNQNIFLIVDSDCDEKEEKKKADRHNKLQEVLKDNLYITKGKEFENMLSVTTLNNILKAYKETGSLNVQQDEYKFKNLGKFIDANLADKKRTYQKDNSISDKLGFCEKALKSITSYEDLSEEAKDICEKLYNFISKNNS